MNTDNDDTETVNDREIRERGTRFKGNRLEFRLRGAPTLTLSQVFVQNKREKGMLSKSVRVGGGGIR